MAKYRKKPVVIEAIRYTRENIGLVMDWIEGFGLSNSEILDYDENSNEYYVKTLEGKMEMKQGNYLLRGVQGEFYPCKPDIFHATYEEVDND